MTMRLWFGMALIAALAACSGLSGPQAPIPPMNAATQPTPAALVVPGPATPYLQGQTPNAEPPTPGGAGTPATLVVVGPTSGSGGQAVSFGNTQLTIPAGWSGLRLQGFQAQFGYAVEALMGGNVTTIAITRFATSPQDTFCERGCIDIIPVAQAKQALGRFAFPPDGQGGMVLFQTRSQTLSFQNGSGTRTLEMHGQGVQFVNNAELRYIFRGYTSDGQYAVYVTFPIQASILPSDPDPAANTNPHVFAPPPALDDPTAIDTFNQQAVTQLNALSPNDFSPNLAWLDALVQSLYVGP